MAEKQKESKTEEGKQSKASKEEQVGFHKGSLSTLAKERQEPARIIGIVEQLMQMHLASLKELGVDLEVEAEKLMGEAAPTKGPSKPKNKPPIEDII
jgi:hypothetical protein